MITVLLLKHFLDVLGDSFEGKQYTHHIDHNAPVPEGSLKLWRSRGHDPSSIGVAHVTFAATPGKDYQYPAYFWEA